MVYCDLGNLDGIRWNLGNSQIKNLLEVRKFTHSPVEKPVIQRLEFLRRFSKIKGK
jgi:hypothetical protein